MSIIEKAVERLEQLQKAAAAASAGATVEAAPVAGSAEGRIEPVGTPVEQPAPVIAAVTAAVTVEAAPVAEVPLPVPSAAPEASVSSRPRASTARSVEIDLERLASIGVVTPNAPRSLIGDEYRIIKRPLLRNIQGKGAAAVDSANLIMVTSSLPGEGKSFSSINLAISMAMELDHTVLLIDADVSRPSILNILGLPPKKGLMDVLTTDDVELGDVLLKTNIDKLTLLPAGTPHPRATELLASDAMNNLLAELAVRYSDRIVVFDSPPLIP
ncbi:MAG TPA: AAA family ATPase, partial [Rhodocyclaceae bacterium]|nr:AAA family ATPase [Rhodocyclaceae bacterium]